MCMDRGIELLECIEMCLSLGGENGCARISSTSAKEFTIYRLTGE
jgi:hypothetical protein